jgi:hypothetical protein
VLRRIFGLKGDEVTGGWRKLNNDELYNLYSSSSTVRMIKPRRMGWTGHVALMGEECYKLMVGKSGRTRPLRRQRCKWVDNTKMDVREIIGYSSTERIHLVQDRDKWNVLVIMAINVWVP